MNRWNALAVLLAIAAALALRVPKLDIRPLHNDEAVNAIKVTELWQHGRYIYDPDEYHGPTLHYATLPLLWLSGARNADELKDATLRVAPVVFGVGLILLLLLFADGLGRVAVVWSAIFTAISPAMVFYSRYFIHEMPLIFFTALTLGSGWRYVQTLGPVEERNNSGVGWAMLFGAGVGLMFATKETFVLTMAAMGVAAIITFVWTSPKGGRFQSLRSFCRWNPVMLALGSALVVWLLFFSSFFTNFSGLLDSIRTYLPWLKRAGGHSPHIHPWSFYLERLSWFHPSKSPVWSEGLILILALVGTLVSLLGGKSPLRRFLALYTIILTAIYCTISYKTPWCLLNFYLGMILLAGTGAAAVIGVFHTKAAKIMAGATVILVLSFPFHRFRLFQNVPDSLAWQSWRANFPYASDRRNPYVYAQTVPDILTLVQRSEGIARLATNGFDTVVKVIAPGNDYWPLPWYLRRFKHIGWYENIPDDPFAPIIVVSSKLNAQLDDKSARKWIMVGITELRPGKFFEQYVELELWKKYVETLPRDRDE